MGVGTGFEVGIGIGVGVGIGIGILESPIILSSNLDTLVEEFPLQVVTGAWPTELLTSKTAGKSLVALEMK